MATSLCLPWKKSFWAENIFFSQNVQCSSWLNNAVKLGDKERFDKEQIVVKEQF